MDMRHYAGRRDCLEGVPGLHRIEIGENTPPELAHEVQRQAARFILPLPEPRNTLRTYLGQFLRGLRYSTRQARAPRRSPWGTPTRR